MSELSCEEVRDALVAGRSPSEPALRAHGQTCAECAPLLADEAALGLSLAAAGAETPGDLALFAELDRQLADETGARAWLRSRPTRLRVVFALTGVLVVTALGVVHPRGDWTLVAKPALVLWLVTFVGTALIAARSALRAFESGPPRRTGALLLAFGVPVAFALVAALTLGAPGSAAAPFFARALACFAYGGALSVPLLGLLWLLDRGSGERSRSLAAAGAGGLAANAALLLHCQASDPAHLLAGHAAIGVAFALVTWRVSR